MEVREDTVIRPDGKPGIFGVSTIKAGVTILAYDKDDTVYLIEDYQYAMEQYGIEAPGGGIDDGESVFDSAKRELEEETGITATEWIDLGSVDPLSVLVNSRQYMYLARGLTQGATSHEGTETIKIIKVSFKEALSWAEEGKIQDAPTVVALLKTAILLQKENS